MGARPHAWVLLALGLALVWRYRWVMDDAFVYARYGDNLVLLRLGLVYNQGELVEGFSSPLWMLWCLAGRAGGLTYGALWTGTGLVAFAASFGLALRIARRLGPEGPAIDLPLAYLAANYAVTSFFSSGLETPLVQLLAFGCAYFLLDPGSRAGRTAIAMAPLVRPELAVVTALALGFVAVREHRVRWRLLGACVALNGAWLLFRIHYYADLLPNTYYLKRDHDVQQGLWYVADTVWTYHFELFVLVCLAGAWAATRARGTAARLSRRVRLEMLALALPIAAWVVLIGGDAMHYRFLAFPFCLACCAGSGLVEHGLASWPMARRRRLYAPIAGLVAAASLSFQPPQRDVHALRDAGDPHLVRGISDPGRHRRNTAMQELASSEADDEAKRLIGRDPEAFRHEAITATGWCSWAYFRYGDRIVHDLGLTDPILARARVRAERPGHKLGLEWLASDLAELYRRAPGGPGPGVLRKAVDEGTAPAWIAENIASIESIERKAYNEHRWPENLALAFTFPDAVDPRSRLRGTAFSGHGVPLPGQRERPAAGP